MSNYSFWEDYPILILGFFFAPWMTGLGPMVEKGLGRVRVNTYEGDSYDLMCVALNYT